MKSNQSGQAIIFSVFFPFFTYVYAFSKKRIEILKYALPIFYGLIGYTFQLRGESDAYRAVEQFDRILASQGFSFFEYFINKVINFKSEGTEVYYDLLCYITSFFIDDWRFFFMLNGFISGTIIFNIVKTINDKFPNVSSLVLVLISLILMPITLLNGRFWLSSSFLVLMILKYIESSKIKYILLSFLCVFIHQGLALACILFALYHFIKFSRNAIFGIYIVSLLYAGSGSNFIGNALNIFSGKVADQIEGYARIDVEEHVQRTLESRSQNFRIYSMRNTVLNITVLTSMFFIFFSNKKNTNEFLVQVALIALLFFAFSNFTSSIASLGGRYLRIGLMIGVIPLLLSLGDIKLRLVRYSLISALTLSYIIDLRLDGEQLYGLIFLAGYPQSFISIPELTILEIIK